MSVSIIDSLTCQNSPQSFFVKNIPGLQQNRSNPSKAFICKHGYMLSNVDINQNTKTRSNLYAIKHRAV